MNKRIFLKQYQTNICYSLIISVPTCSIGQTMFLNTSLNYNAINFSAFYTFEKKILLKTPALCCMQCLLGKLSFLIRNRPLYVILTSRKKILILRTKNLFIAINYDLNSA